MPATEILDRLTLDTNSHEIFWMGLVKVDIRQAKRILAAKKCPPRVNTVQIADLARYVRRPTTPTCTNGGIQIAGGPIELDWELVESEEVDLTVPILLGRFPKTIGDFWPIDGWHRIAKAIDRGMTELPCYIMSIEDSRKVATFPK